MMRSRDRLAQVLPSRRRRVMSIAGAQSLDGPFQYRCRGFEVGIADAQQYDVFTALVRRATLEDVFLKLTGRSLVD